MHMFSTVSCCWHPILFLEIRLLPYLYNPMVSWSPEIPLKNIKFKMWMKLELF